jgi:SulP family sulfate permease
VTEIDSTASLSFRKLEQLAESSDMTLVFTELSPGIQQRLEQAGLADRERIHVFADLDRGLAWAEEQLLAAKGISPKASSNLAQQLATLLADEERAERLLPYLRRQEVTAGECLIRQGERPDALYFVEAGQVTAQLERPGEKPIRLQTMRGGHVIGEIGFYLRQERTAAVVADEASVIYSLPLEALQRMEREDPVTASTLHQLIARLLAERVTHLVRTVDALQR